MVNNLKTKLSDMDEKWTHSLVEDDRSVIRSLGVLLEE